MIKCKRCGRCCLYLKNGIEVRCKYLIGIIDKITSCRIYRQRLGRVINVLPLPYGDVICASRNPKQIIEGCPYNEVK